MLKPTQDWCLVRQIEQKLSETLVVTDTWGLRDKMLLGEVLAVGPGTYTKKRKFVPTELQIGNKVLFDRRKRELYLENDCFLVRERDIDCIL